MAVVLNTNLKINKAVPVDTRNSFDTLKAMREFNYRLVDVGHVTFCKATKKRYEFIGPGETSSPNEFRDGDNGTGYWREMVFNVDVDLASINQDIDTLKNTLKNLGDKEVIQVSSLPAASKDTVKALYLVPVEGSTTFTEHITTKTRKAATLAIPDDDPVLIGLCGTQDFTNYDVRMGDYALDVYDNQPVIVQQEFEIENATPDWQSTGIAVNIGDRIYTNTGKCYVATENDWVEDKDPFNYAWLTIGQTSYDMSTKQDALEFNGQIITADIYVNGVKKHFMLQGEEYTNPALPLVSLNNTNSKKVTEDNVDKYWKVALNVSPTTEGSSAYYHVEKGTTDAVEPETTDSYTKNSAVCEITCNADGASVYSQDFAFSASAYKLGLWSADGDDKAMVTYTGTVYYKLKMNAPSIGGSRTDSSRQVTLSLKDGSAKTGTQIYYTKDNSDVNPSDTAHTYLYEGPFNMSATGYVKYKAVNENCIDSDQMTSEKIIVGSKPVLFGVLTNRTTIDDVIASDITEEHLDILRQNNNVPYYDQELSSSYSMHWHHELLTGTKTAVAVFAIPGNDNDFKPYTELGPMREKDNDYSIKSLNGYRVLIIPFAETLDVTIKQ